MNHKKYDCKQPKIVWSGEPSLDLKSVNFYDKSESRVNGIFIWTVRLVSTAFLLSFSVIIGFLEYIQF